MSMNVFSWEEAQTVISKLKDQNSKVVSTNGCFDILHRGHVEYLEKSKRLGDYLIVAINSDESVQKLKGPTRPFNNELDRAIVLSALESVDAVCIFSEQTPIRWLEFLQPHIHCKGGDYKAEELPEYPVMKKWKGRIEIVPFITGYSTTQTLKNMEEK